MKVTLLKPHKHAGKKYAADEKIEVNEADAQWLADPARKVIAPLPAGKGGTASTTESNA
jgi:hypothetical protein